MRCDNRQTPVKLGALDALPVGLLVGGLLAAGLYLALDGTLPR